MCGRFTLSNVGQLSLRFDVDAGPQLALEPRYNVAPAQEIPVIVREGERTITRLMRWGLGPARPSAGSTRPAPINARAETLMERPLFRPAVIARRCLIPADGFYEWHAVAGEKTRRPYYFQLSDGTLFAFAGLYNEGPDGPNCALITTTPNALVTPIHDRMPAILARRDEAAWLDRELREPAAVHPLLGPYPADQMRSYAVANLVSSVRNEGAELIAPLA